MKPLHIVVLALVAAAPAAADVCVQTDGGGHYRALQVGSVPQDGRLLHWRPAGTSQAGYDCLNAAGDDRGDLRPRAVVVPAASASTDPLPVVVWPRNTGASLDIFYSVWRPGVGWSAYAPLADSPADETGVDLYLDPHGHVHAVWWTNSATPAVWSSIYADGRWSPVERLSPENQDCRGPYFVLSGGALYVDYLNWTFPPAQVNCRLKERFDP